MKSDNEKDHIYLLPLGEVGAAFTLLCRSNCTTPIS